MSAVEWEEPSLFDPPPEPKRRGAAVSHTTPLHVEARDTADPTTIPDRDGFDFWWRLPGWDNWKKRR
jgi:hypothetical protein